MNLVLWASLLLLLFILGFKRPIFCKWRYYRWSRALKLPSRKRVFDALYKNVNGFSISQRARQGNPRIDLTYGEIRFEPFVALLSCCNINATTVFYDLGSGTGKAVIAATLTFPLKRAIGVELLLPLHECAQLQQKSLSMIPICSDKADKIEFKCGDILNVPLQECTLIFINATAYFGEVWERICQHLQTLPANGECICISKTLPSNAFERLRSTKIEMSWGVSVANIYRRRP